MSLVEADPRGGVFLIATGRKTPEQAWELIAQIRQALHEGVPGLFRCHICGATHGSRYDDALRDPSCPHRGDYFLPL